VAIVVAGSLIPEGLKACEELERQNKGYILVNANCLNHIDLRFYKNLLGKTSGKLVTVEDHQLKGGFGQILVHNLATAGIQMKVKTLAVKNQFGQSAYNAIDLYKKHGLDSAAIVKAVTLWP
jgi:transketolase